MKEKDENKPKKKKKNNPFPIKEMKEKIIKIKSDGESEALRGKLPDNTFLLDEMFHYPFDFSTENYPLVEKLREHPLTPEECFKKMVFEDKQIFINNSGYKHAPYLISWVDAYGDCGVDILNKEQLKEKYNIVI